MDEPGSDGADAGAAGAASARSTGSTDSLPESSGPICPVCARVADDGDIYCERCGAPLRAPAATVRWYVEVSVDADHYRRTAGTGAAPLPAARTPVSVELAEAEAFVGRSSRRGGERPTVDLSGELTDHGVSHRHAVLRRRADGGWSITDLGSTNGTFVGDADDPLEVGEPVALANGAFVRIGAWTRLTLVGRVEH